MKHRIFKTIVWIAVILVIITFAGSYFIGLQVVSNSTQLTNPEDTKDVQIEYWKENNFNIRDINEILSYIILILMTLMHNIK